MRSTTSSTTRSRAAARALRAAALSAAALIALAGCAGPEADDEPSPSQPEASETAVPDALASPAPSVDAGTGGDDAAEALEDFATGDGTLSFRYPVSWTLETEATDPIAAAGPDGDRVIESGGLTAPNGQELVVFTGLVDVGGACGGEEYERDTEVLAAEPAGGDVDGETVVATVATERLSGLWQVGIGITTPERLESAPCGVSFLATSTQGLVTIGTSLGTTTTGDPDPLWDVESIDDARDYMETGEYESILEILRSVELR